MVQINKKFLISDFYLLLLCSYLYLIWLFPKLIHPSAVLSIHPYDPKFGGNTIISFVYISISVPVYPSYIHGKNNLSNPKAYSDPSQTSKMECLAKMVNG